jgi:hypothetical protein
MERVYIELWNPLIRLLNDAQAWASLSSLSFMLKDASDAQAQACLSTLSINRLALQAWRRWPSRPVTQLRDDFILYKNRLIVPENNYLRTELIREIYK